MKFLQLTLVSLFFFAATGFAQSKTAGKAVIKTASIQCDMCKGKIEKALFKQQGISSVKVDVKKKTTTVTWMPDRTNIENIKTMIANVGYDADDVTADEDAYKRLPACCKKPNVEEVKEEKN